MIILVDGYNMLKSITQPTVTDHERMQFITMLGRYAQRKHHKVVVVFDGGSYEWIHKETHKGIRVIYSGVHETADDFIKQYLEEHKTRDLLLVTTDHELGIWASQLSIPSINALDFYTLIQDALHIRPTVKEIHGGSLIKMTEQSDASIDALMQETVIIPVKEDDIARVQTRDKLKSLKVSKRDRLLLRKLKKL